MFTPKWKKHSKLLYKGSQKFLNYKKDLLSDDRIDEIESRRKDLKDSIKASDKEKAKEAGKLLEKTCEQALPRYKGNNALQENLEVIFVAIVVALGIRTYFLQPFRIPTNSMYPTLNGITGHELAKDKWPFAPVRLAQHATHGRNYFSLKTESECYITSIQEYTAMHFFPRVKISFSDGREETFSGSKTTIFQGGLTSLIDKLVQEQYPQYWRSYAQHTPEHRAQAYEQKSNINGKTLSMIFAVKIPADTVIAEGFSQTGDLILVDKVSYHFRKPEAGEVFVFDTRGIKMQKTEDTHYIKRLIGVPGDRLKLDPSIPKTGYPMSGVILRDGALAQQPGILRVQSHEGSYKGYGNIGGNMRYNMQNEFQLKDKPSTGLSEYWAMGDNSFNSSDSRAWGTVKEYNVVGPAFFSLWPFGSGHWGVIK